MINNTTLVGRLTKSPELRYTGSGIAVLSFTLAVERNYTNAQGERATDFINCQAWRGTAEIISKFATKGSLVGITGSIQTRNYQNNEGKTVYITEVIVDEFQMLEPKSVTDERRNQQSNGENNFSNNQQPQQNYTNSQNSNNSNRNITNQPTNNALQQNQTDDNPFQNLDDVTDISDDDLPF